MRMCFIIGTQSRGSYSNNKKEKFVAISGGNFVHSS